MKFPGKLMRMARINFKTMVSFVILCRIFISGVFPPFFSFVLSRAMQLAGMRYLTAENIHRFMANPLAVLIAAMPALFYAWAEMIELSGIIYIYDQSRSGRRTSFAQTFLYAAAVNSRLPARLIRFITNRAGKGSSKARQPDQTYEKVPGADRSVISGLTILLVMLALTPAFHLTALANSMWTYALGGRLIRIIRRHWYYSALFSAGVFGYFYLFLRLMYLIHFYVLEGYGTKRAFRESLRLSRDQTAQTAGPMVLVQIVPTGVFFLIIILMLIVTTLIGQSASLSGAGVSSLQVVLISAAVSVLDAVMLPLLTGWISSDYYELRRKAHEKIRRQPHMSEALDQKPRTRLHAAELIILGVSLCTAIIYLYGISRGRYTLRIEHLRHTAVTAHRGASMYYPENTLAAIEGAVQEGASWVEIDVNESRDGQIFLMHDSNFRRTTGVDKNAWELDYDEIAQLDAGSWFSRKFAGEKIPLLSEAIELAQANNISLNIEIKLTGHEQDIVPHVISIVQEAGFTDSCVITSQQYKVIQQIKKLDEDIRTVYVMGLAYGAINRLGAADAFSIRSTSISQSLVRDLHNRGIEVYAWTVDSRDNINRMINLGVDNIITNNVPLAIECVNDSRSGRLVSEFVKSLRETFSQ